MRFDGSGPTGFAVYGHVLVVLCDKRFIVGVGFVSGDFCEVSFYGWFGGEFDRPIVFSRQCDGDGGTGGFCLVFRYVSE